jgi:hypothetical protein
VDEKKRENFLTVVRYDLKNLSQIYGRERKEEKDSIRPDTLKTILADQTCRFQWLICFPEKNLIVNGLLVA